MTINELTIVIAAWSLLSGASRSKGGVTLVRKISQEWTTFSLNDFQKNPFPDLFLHPYKCSVLAIYNKLIVL